MADGSNELLGAFTAAGHEWIARNINVRTSMVLVGEPCHIARLKRLFDSDDALLGPGAIATAQEKRNRLAEGERAGKELG
jgi:hypothetical protein